MDSQAQPSKQGAYGYGLAPPTSIGAPIGTTQAAESLTGRLASVYDTTLSCHKLLGAIMDRLGVTEVVSPVAPGPPPPPPPGINGLALELRNAILALQNRLERLVPDL